MADSKISTLPAATTPLGGAETVPIVQSGVTRDVSVADLTAGRSVTAAQITLTTGNLVVASGNGVDFSATPGSGTSELLNDYEEGTWSPTWNGGTVTVNSGVYTKVGRLVHLILDVTFGASASGTESQLSIPFPCGTAWGTGSVNYTDYGTSLVVNLEGSTDIIAFRSAINDANIAASAIAGKRVIFGVTYFA